MGGILAVVAVAGALALPPADATRVDPHTVAPGARTTVVVECARDPGPAIASSPLFGEVELLRTAAPGEYRAYVTVPGRAVAGTYPVDSPCGTTSVRVAPSVASAGTRNGPTYIGIGLLLGGLVLAVLATRRPIPA